MYVAVEGAVAAPMTVHVSPCNITNPHDWLVPHHVSCARGHASKRSVPEVPTVRHVPPPTRRSLRR